MSRHTRYLKLGALAFSAFLCGSTPVFSQQLSIKNTPEMIQQAAQNPQMVLMELKIELSKSEAIAAIKANPARALQMVNDPAFKPVFDANPALKAQVTAMINGIINGKGVKVAGTDGVKPLFPLNEPARMIINLKTMDIRQYNLIEYGQMQEQIKRGLAAGNNPYYTNSHALKGRLEFVRVPAGTFLMGSSLSEEDRMADEERHEVQLTDDFWVGAFEVSQEQWKMVMGQADQAIVTHPPLAGTKEVPKLIRGNSLPMYNITQEEAQQFCRRLTMMVRRAAANAAAAAKNPPKNQPKIGPDGKPVLGPDGKPVMVAAPAPKAPSFVLPDDWEFMLPTEAQWEYVCRAGGQTAFGNGETLMARDANYNVGRIKREIVVTRKQDNQDNQDMGDMPPDMLMEGEQRQEEKKSEIQYVEEDYIPIIKPIGSCNPNAWGIYDMHGSVWEWCRGAYYLYPSTKMVDPQGSRNGRLYVTRGGGWYSYSKDCRAARRQDIDRETRQDNIGFRVILCRKR